MAAALKPFLAQRNAIVIWAVIAVVVVLLALLAVWWWLVGRNARNVSAELLQLYQISNQQIHIRTGLRRPSVHSLPFGAPLNAWRRSFWPAARAVLPSTLLGTLPIGALLL